MNKRLMNTVDETYARVLQENIGVSKHFIRRSVQDGTLPCIRSGNRYLINWHTFLQFLDCSGSTESFPSHSIRKVER